MKKTVSVNIKGINFLIEEDAYELLQDYMDRLTIALKNEDGSKEIIEDVELRIAEICAEKISDSKTVIELIDIEDILAALGNPEEYVDEDEANTTEKETIEDRTKADGKGDRRLFRDGDAATLGGVCAGVANYFGIDVVIIRAIFVVFLLFGGFGFPLYIILWVIIPKAASTIDKLRMRGRPITVESVKQEVENAAERVKSDSKNFANKVRHDDNYKQRISRGRRIVASIFGIGFMGMGLMFSVMFTVFIIGGFEFLPFDGDSGFISLTEFGELILSDSGDVKLAWIGGLMMSLSAILFCFLCGTLLLFNLKNKWSKWTLGGLFVTGFIGVLITASLGIRTGRDFAFPGESQFVVGKSNQQELVIIPRLNGQVNANIYHVGRHGNFMNVELTKNSIKSHGINVQYVPTTDTSFQILQVLTSSGPSSDIARIKSENISHGVELRNDTLYVDVEYLYPQKDKLRDQEVTIVIHVPQDRSVRVNNKIVHLGTDPEESKGVNHPYYKEEGRIRADGSYDHYRGNYRYFDREYDNALEREIKEEILEEFDLD